MSFLFEPNLHVSSNFLIYHNATPYSVDPTKMLASSQFFCKIYSESGKQKISINDTHKESAFETFINICLLKPTNVNAKDRDEILSLFDEWECAELKKSFLNSCAKNLVLEGQEEHDNDQDTNPQQPEEEENKASNEANQQNSSHLISHNENESVTKDYNESNSNIQLPPQNQQVTNEVNDTNNENSETLMLNQEQAKIEPTDGNETMRNKKKPFKVHIKTRTGSLYVLSLTNDNTIADLKSLIRAKTGIQPERQILFFNSNRIEQYDNKTVESFGIGKKSKIYVEKTDELDKGDEIVIFAIDLKSKTKEKIPFYISISKAVKDLENMIKNKMQNPTILHIYLSENDQRKALEQEFTLKSYGISKENNVVYFQYLIT